MITYLVLYLVFALVTLALSSLASFVVEQERLELHEAILILIFWPVFLVLLIIRLNRSE